MYVKFIFYCNFLLLQIQKDYLAFIVFYVKIIIDNFLSIIIQRGGNSMLYTSNRLTPYEELILTISQLQELYESANQSKEKNLDEVDSNQQQIISE